MAAAESDRIPALGQAGYLADIERSEDGRRVGGEERLSVIADGGADFRHEPTLPIRFKSKLRFVEQHDGRSLHQRGGEAEQSELSRARPGQRQRNGLSCVGAFEEADQGEQGPPLRRDDGQTQLVRKPGLSEQLRKRVRVSSASSGSWSPAEASETAARNAARRSVPLAC